jgi:hypothetical protein
MVTEPNLDYCNQYSYVLTACQGHRYCGVGRQQHCTGYELLDIPFCLQAIQFANIINCLYHFLFQVDI